MTHTTELRLGNLLLVNSKIIGKVTRIYEDHAQVEYTAVSDTTGQPYVKRSYIDCQWLDGIPLTEDHFEGVNGITVKWSLKGRAEISMCGIPITVISHLHEWQNLYYLLLGSELEI